MSFGKTEKVKVILLYQGQTLKCQSSDSDIQKKFEKDFKAQQKSIAFNSLKTESTGR